MADGLPGAVAAETKKARQGLEAPSGCPSLVDQHHWWSDERAAAKPQLTKVKHLSDAIAIAHLR